MRLVPSVLSVLLLISSIFIPTLQAQRANPNRGRQKSDLNAEDVRKSISKAVSFLRQSQSVQGSRSSDSQFKFGVSPLCTLALLNAGESPNDPKIAAGIRFIKNLPYDKASTYTVSLRIMVLAAADPGGRIFRKEIQRDVDWLLDAQIKSGKSIGGWDYGRLGGMRAANSSTCQFALLGLHEASRVGVRIPQKNWEMAAEYWEKAFVKGSGGFGYNTSGSKPTGSMTCAGISSVIIIEENLANEAKFIKNGTVNCCADNQNGLMVEAALDWLGRGFKVSGNPMGGRRGDRDTTLYYLYALERAGRLSGRRFIGAHDWYREGAQALVKRQAFDGSWQGGGRFGESDKDIGTALALLFLAKGKRPIVIGKYKHGVNRDWDLHPKGVHQLTRDLEIQWNAKLNWQTINGRDADVDDLREAPVLFFSGRDDLDMNTTQKTNLKKYIENGGFVFAEACQGDGCGNNVEFDRKFREVMAELFPDSQLDPLPIDHPMWNAHYRLKPEPDWPVLGLQACCRTSVIYCPRNLTCYWQANRSPLVKRMSRGTARDVEYCSQLGVNVVSYATGRQLRDKLDLPKLAEDPGQQILGDRVLILPKLQHNGGADEAPNAWRNVLLKAREAGLRIKMDKKMIRPVNEELFDHPFVFIHGRDRFSFTKEEREALREHLMNRGFLFVDSICSSRDFSESFRKEIKEILPEFDLQPIPATHPLWNDDRFGGRIGNVTLRVPDENVMGGFRDQKTPPLMEGVTIDDHLAVVFSPYDLSCALENASVSQCEGYTNEDAAVIGRQVLLYFLQSD